MSAVDMDSLPESSRRVRIILLDSISRMALEQKFGDHTRNLWKQEKNPSSCARLEVAVTRITNSKSHKYTIKVLVEENDDPEPSTDTVGSPTPLVEARQQRMGTSSQCQRSTRVLFDSDDTRSTRIFLHAESSHEFKYDAGQYQWILVPSPTQTDFEQVCRAIRNLFGQACAVSLGGILHVREGSAAMEKMTDEVMDEMFKPFGQYNDPEFREILTRLYEERGTRGGFLDSWFGGRDRC